MKARSLALTLVLAASAALAGCHHGLSQREEECLDAGGTVDTCTYEGRRHAERMALAEQGVDPDQYNNFNYGNADYPPAEAGQTYTNYYGDPRYGHWVGGYYHFYNPYGMYAIQTNSYLLSAGLHGLAAYIGTRAALHSAWHAANPSGYHVVRRRSTSYYGRGGRILTRSQATAARTRSTRYLNTRRKTIKRVKPSRTTKKLNKLNIRHSRPATTRRPTIRPTSSRNSSYTSHRSVRRPTRSSYSSHRSAHRSSRRVVRRRH